MDTIITFLRTASFIAAFLFILSTSASAVTYTVNQAGDAGDLTCDATCTLRDALDDANGGPADTIVFDATVFPVAPGVTTTITLNAAAGDIVISDGDLTTITGPGARSLIVNQTIASNRVFDVSGLVSISGMTISGGNETNAAGGGINVTGTLTLIAVRVTGNTNSGGDGGGIFNSGVMVIRDCLIDGNSTTGGGNQGGGLYNLAAGDTIAIANSTITNNTTGGAGTLGGGIFVTAGTVSLNNVTISHNTAAASGGGINNFGGTVNIRNTIVANNVSTTDAGDEDITGAFVSTAAAGGSNLIRIIGDATGFTDGVNGDDIGTAGTPLEPSLGPLQNNFGPTNTRAITTASPAYNTGNVCVTDLSCTANDPPVALTTDQRGTGFPRNNVGAVDKGAYEFNVGPSAAGVSLSGRVMNDFGRGISRVVVTLSGGPLAEPMQTFTGSFGYYTFNDVPAGQSYVISVRAKQHVFANPTLVVTADDNISGLDFIAERVVFKSEK